MTQEVRLRPEAEQDLLEAAIWYEEQNPGLGHRFLDEALKIFDTVRDSPSMYPNVYRDVRRALIHRFPFGIFYRVENTAIVVIAVMHASRAPTRWKKRAS